MIHPFFAEYFRGISPFFAEKDFPMPQITLSYKQKALPREGKAFESGQPTNKGASLTNVDAKVK